MDRRRGAAVGTIAFAALVPGTVLGLLPWRIAGRGVHPPLGGTPLTRWLGGGRGCGAASG